MKTFSIINSIVGDYSKGEVVVYVTKVAGGKTKILFNETVHSIINGNNVLFCETELGTKKVAEEINKAFKFLSADEHKLNNSAIIKSILISESNHLKKIDLLIRTLRSNGKSIDVLVVDGYINSNYKEKFKELKRIAKEFNVLVIVSETMQLHSIEDSIGQIVEITNIEEVDYLYSFDIKQEHLRILKIKRENTNFKVNAKLDIKNNIFNINYDNKIDKEFFKYLKGFQETVYIITEDLNIGKIFLQNLVQKKLYQGKTILYLTDKLKNRFYNENYLGKIMYDLYPFNNIVEYIKSMYKKYGINVVIIEDDKEIFQGKNYEEIISTLEAMRNVSIEFNIQIIYCSKSKKSKEEKEINLSSITQTQSKVAVSDTVIAISKHRSIFYKNNTFVVKDLKYRSKINYEKYLFKISNNNRIKIVKKLKYNKNDN